MTTEAENSGIELVEAGSDDGRRMKWYVVTTYSGYENKVKQALRERIRQHKMEERFGEVLIPSESVTLHGKDDVPRLRLRRDADERRGMAPRERDAEGDRLHRQPATPRSEAPAHRGSA